MTRPPCPRCGHGAAGPPAAHMSGAATTPSPGCLDGRSGKVNMEVNDVLEQQDLDDGLILACQSRPETDSVEVTYDE